MTIVSTSYSKTGTFTEPETWLRHIAFYTGILEELAKQHRVHSIERISYTGLLLKQGVTYHFIRQHNQVARFPHRMHRLIKKLQPDVVLVNGFCFPLQLIQLRLTLGPGVKIIVLHRSEKPAAGWRKWLQICAGSCVNAYLFSSKEIGLAWTTKGIIRQEKKMVECIQASSAFVPEEKTVSRKNLSIAGHPVFLWVGRLDKNKDPLTVAKAFLDFCSFHPEARLYMIFQSEELLTEIKALLQNHPAAASVNLVGKVPHRDLQAWYSSADFLVSGSHNESCGIALAEAMSCGCIPVITDIPSFRKIAGSVALFYKVGDIAGLQQALRSSLLLDHTAQRQKVLDSFQKELSFTAIANKISSLCFDV